MRNDAKTIEMTETLAYPVTHLRVLSESYPMNTHKLTGFRWFSKIFASSRFNWKKGLLSALEGVKYIALFAAQVIRKIAGHIHIQEVHG